MKLFESSQSEIVQAFIDISMGLSESAENISISVGQLEFNYNRIKNANAAIPNTLDVDNIIRQGFMENMLRRDTYSLLETILRLRVILLESIGSLIQSGNSVLSETYQNIKTNSENENEFHLARSKLVGAINLLETLDSKLRSMDS